MGHSYDSMGTEDIRDFYKECEKHVIKLITVIKTFSQPLEFISHYVAYSFLSQDKIQSKRTKITMLTEQNLICAVLVF